MPSVAVASDGPKNRIVTAGQLPLLDFSAVLHLPKPKPKR